MPEPDHLEVEILLGALRGGGGRGGLPDVLDAALDAADEVLAHLEERVARAHQHAADGDRPHDELPDVDDHRAPGRFLAAAPGQVLVDERRPEEVDERRDEQAPRQQAAGEVQRAELGADDVAHAEVGRGDVRRREMRHPAGGHLGHGLADAQLDEALLHRADLDRHLVRGPEDPEAVQQLDHRAHEHGAEQLQRGFRSLLAGLVDFRRGHRLGEGQRRGLRPSRAAGS